MDALWDLTRHLKHTATPGYFRRHQPGSHFRTAVLEDPLAPKLTKRFEVPSSVARGGWSYGYEGCGVDMGWGFWHTHSLR